MCPENSLPPLKTVVQKIKPHYPQFQALSGMYFCLLNSTTLVESDEIFDYWKIDIYENT